MPDHQSCTRVWMVLFSPYFSRCFAFGHLYAQERVTDMRSNSNLSRSKFYLWLAHAPSGFNLRRTPLRSCRMRGSIAMSTPLFRQMKSPGFCLPIKFSDSDILRGLKRPVKLCGEPDRFNTRLFADSTGACVNSQNSRHRSPYQEAALR